jgi:hypothetical protein
MSPSLLMRNPSINFVYPVFNLVGSSTGDEVLVVFGELQVEVLF